MNRELRVWEGVGQVPTVPTVATGNARLRYFRLARWAMGHGLLTWQEVRVIARLGTRKECYWSRHLLDLRAVVRARLGR